MGKKMEQKGKTAKCWEVKENENIVHDLKGND